ncbi:MAG TPA: hypothetical protein P5084_01625 [Paludibacter sp.]|nr:hypothetical protein [Paludibacter sp.]
MRKYLLLFLLIPFLYGCPPPCEQEEQIDNGHLSNAALSLVPYQQAEIYKFKHTNGYVIEFSTERSSSTLYMDMNFNCGPTSKYEENTTTLKSDYPIFDINLYVSNSEKDYNSVSIFIGRSAFAFKYSNSNGFMSDQFQDSVMINTKKYYNVERLANFNTFYDELAFADSIYYNQEIGIIKIKLSNGEDYTVEN